MLMVELLQVGDASQTQVELSFLPASLPACSIYTGQGK